MELRQSIISGFYPSVPQTTTPKYYLRRGHLSLRLTDTLQTSLRNYFQPTIPTSRQPTFELHTLAEEPNRSTNQGSSLLPLATRTSSETSASESSTQWFNARSELGSPSHERTHDAISNISEAGNNTSPIPGDSRLTYIQWSHDNRYSDVVFDSLGATFTVAGNGRRLCPALLMNQDLFLSLGQLVWQEKSDPERRIHKMEDEVQKGDDRIREIEEYLEHFGPKAHIIRMIQSFIAQGGYTDLVDFLEQILIQIDWWNQESTELRIQQSELLEQRRLPMKRIEKRRETPARRVSALLETAFIQCGAIPLGHKSDYNQHLDHTWRLTNWGIHDKETLDSEVICLERHLGHLRKELQMCRDSYTFQFRQWACHFCRIG